MSAHSRFATFVAGLATLGALAQAGCSGLNSRGSGLVGLKGKSDTQLGQTQSDQYGRPMPGSRTPVPTAVPEAKPEVSDQTRSHIGFAMGEMLESVGNLEAAQAQYEQALKSEPKSLNAALALARVYARQGRPDAALKVYTTAEKHHRRSAALFNDKGLLLADQKDWPAAIAALRTAVKLEPSESKYHNNLGMVLATSGNYEEAYKEFRDAVGAGPAHYNVALMLLQADRPDEARNHLERALAAMPQLQKAQELLAQLDNRSSGTTLTSNEREVAVDLDRSSDSKETRNVEPAYDSNVQNAEAASITQPTPVQNPEPPANETDDSPWSRRWVPPKWLR